jgi:peptidoglycan hydrolase-like protein with peptidoglycan-binding domain
MKKIVKLTESDLIKIIKKVINEGKIYSWDEVKDLVKKEPVYNVCNLAGGKVVIGKGNQGPLVAYFQHLLNSVISSYPDKFPNKEELVVDGIFGQKTKEVTMDFQKMKGLNPDGTIGGKTCRRFNIAGYSGKENFMDTCPGIKPPSYIN